jgi:diguanylate cyclase (GGDEF)-like protein
VRRWSGVRAYLEPDSALRGPGLNLSAVPQERTLAQRLSGAFVFFGALVAGAFLVTTLAYGLSWAWLTPELERSRLAVRTETAAYAAMLDEENVLRTYLLTHDPRFIGGPYARAEGALARANQTLTASVGSVPQVAAAMLAMRMAQERWQDQWARVVAGAPPEHHTPAMADGQTLFDAYRRDEAALADVLNERRDVLSRREQRVIGARVALELAVFVAILLFAVRQHRALHEAIVEPVAGLLRHIRHIRDGQLEATADGGGPRELAELAEGLNEMVRALAAARQSATSRDQALRDHAVRLRQILDASREFSESLNLAYVVGAVKESTATVGGYAHVVVWLMDDEQKRLINAEKSGAAASPDSAPVEMGHGLAGRAAKSGRITFEGPARQVHFRDGNADPVYAIAIPLIVGARVVGALEARHDEAKGTTTEEIEIIEMLATHAATAIESARLHEVIEERSQMDALTRLYNRRRLEEDLDAECKRCARYERPLAFVMLDVDHFKAFNDSHGHPQADTVLQGVADIIAGCVRTTDTAYRYGGEEFCILLRETSAQDAMLFAERVRQRIAQRFSSGASAGVTASFGVAGFSADAPTPRALVEAADAATYDSKHAGRNRVSLATPLPMTTGDPNDDFALPRA